MPAVRSSPLAAARVVQSSPPDAVLPAAARVHTRTDHRTVARTGRRARRGALLVLTADAGPAAGQARATVVAGRKVGPAVVRNRVKRQVRAALKDALTRVPDGSLVVVRALQGAADAGYRDLAGWLDAGLAATAPRTRRESAPAAAAAPSRG